MRDRFNRVAEVITRALGSPFALAIAAGVVITWAVTGPVFGFSDSWQLIINTGTTIVTFLMVFVIQTAANRDARAMHLKLDEIIRSIDSARNAFIVVEQETDDEMERDARELQALANGTAPSTRHTRRTTTTTTLTRAGRAAEAGAGTAAATGAVRGGRRRHPERDAAAR
jgi:low affinity Fe/Cu permease